MNGDNSELTALRARVQGRVQGVYYRAFAERHARHLQICGYVRNCRDGSVELYAEGPREKLTEFLELLKKGPPGARVDAINPRWMESSGKYTGFTIVS